MMSHTFSTNLRCNPAWRPRPRRAWRWACFGPLLGFIVGCATTEPETAITRADELWRDDRRDEAIDLLDRAIEKNRDAPELHSAKLSYLLENKEFELALQETREAVKRMPSAPELHVLQGKIHRTLGEDQKAERAYRRAVRLYTSEIRRKPWVELPIVARATVYYFLGDLDKALSDCHRAKRVTVRDDAILELMTDIECVRNGEEPLLTDDLSGEDF